MRKTLSEQLKQWEKQHKDLIRKSSRKSQKRKTEELTKEDIEDLMGINRPTYRRGKGGAWRNGR